MAPSRPIFLSAEWRWLAMLSWRVDPALLAPLVPAGTTLDVWQGRTFVSLVAFLFRDTRVLGVPIPLHRHFEEMNLRFYVRRVTDGEVRRGVTFIREVVPRRAIATVARLAYDEPYVALPMRHRIDRAPAGDAEAPARVEYGWRLRGVWGRLAVTPRGEPSLAAAGSEEEFITEHYWGYTRQRDGGTVEYQVRHPRWDVWQVSDARVDADLESLYGPGLAAVLRGAPSSVFLARGSPVTVHWPARLPRRATARSGA